MGKTTLYHPVGLKIIRGAAQFGGFNLGRIKQSYASVEHGQASYTIEVNLLPAAASHLPMAQIALVFESLFSADVEVLGATWDRKFGYQLFIRTYAQLDDNLKTPEVSINDIPF